MYRFDDDTSQLHKIASNKRNNAADNVTNSHVKQETEYASVFSSVTIDNVHEGC